MSCDVSRQVRRAGVLSFGMKWDFSCRFRVICPCPQLQRMTALMKVTWVAAEEKQFQSSSVIILHGPTYMGCEILVRKTFNSISINNPPLIFIAIFLLNEHFLCLFPNCEALQALHAASSLSGFHFSMVWLMSRITSERWNKQMSRKKPWVWTYCQNETTHKKTKPLTSFHTGSDMFLSGISINVDLLLTLISNTAAPHFFLWAKVNLFQLKIPQIFFKPII